jgi:FlaA1/EpsC-like NDP-sugar epimerase
MSITEAAQLVIQSAGLDNNGGVFVLDMGEPVKIVNLAMKMISLSGFEPVFSTKNPDNSRQIEITYVGLRPGEKMHEELTYGKKLFPTAHPRIMRTAEPQMTQFDCEALFKNLLEARDNRDYQKLLQIISSVCDGVSDFNTSTDIFISKERSITEKINSFEQKNLPVNNL